jgi:hypothetical protein
MALFQNGMQVGNDGRNSPKADSLRVTLCAVTGSGQGQLQTRKLRYCNSESRLAPRMVKVETHRTQDIYAGRVAPRVTHLAQAAAGPFSGSQMLILRVSGMRKRASTKHTAGTAIG